MGLFVKPPYHWALRRGAVDNRDMGFVVRNAGRFLLAPANCHACKDAHRPKAPPSVACGVAVDRNIRAYRYRCRFVVLASGNGVPVPAGFACRGGVCVASDFGGPASRARTNGCGDRGQWDTGPGRARSIVGGTRGGRSYGLVVMGTFVVPVGSVHCIRIRTLGAKTLGDGATCGRTSASGVACPALHDV